jgi:hypothetical protein
MIFAFPDAAHNGSHEASPGYPEVTMHRIVTAFRPAVLIMTAQIVDSDSA